MDTPSPGLASWRLSLRSRLCAVAAFLVFAALVWYLLVGTPGGPHTDEIARMIELGRSHTAFSAFERWWLLVSGNGLWLLAAAVAVQLACVLLVYSLASSVTRSVAVPAIAGVLALVSPFPQEWVSSPSGLSDSITALAMLVMFGAVLLPIGDARLRNGASFAAVLVSGWPIAAVAVVAAALRNVVGTWLLVAGATALAVRVAVGLPPSALVGHVGATGPYALTALRALVFCVAAAPAVVFAATRSRAKWLKKCPAPEYGSLLAALVLAIAAGFLFSAPVASFCAEMAVLLVGVRVAARSASHPMARNGLVLAAAGVFAVSCFAWADAGRTNDSPTVAQDRGVVQGIPVSDELVLVDHGDSTYSRRYSKDVLSYLAGHAVDVRFSAQPPGAITGAVLDAGPRGLQRIDPALRAVLAVEKSRERVVDDIYANSKLGQINDNSPQGTPSGLGVVPSMSVPGPRGAIGSIIVLSGFTYSFHDVAVKPGQRLVYLVAKALQAGTAARATVTIDAHGKSMEVQDDVLPAPSWGSPDWRYRSIALPVKVPSHVTITFAASSPSGRNVGDWIAYGAPAIVAP
jgi:hypothetical protein